MGTPQGLPLTRPRVPSRFPDGVKEVVRVYNTAVGKGEFPVQTGEPSHLQAFQFRHTELTVHPPEHLCPRREPCSRMEARLPLGG